ncbi:MAG: hypothetical protein KF886_25965 [Candidatus Hydrogenedentes bacterium]|nr:hypothetical protein [Candidatus Hydrogenedentota bacterium]
MKPVRLAANLILLLAILAATSPAPAEFVPLEGMAIQGPITPSEGELLAVRAFNMRLAQFTGTPAPVLWGAANNPPATLLVGTRVSQPDAFAEFAGALPDVPNSDAADQSYRIASTESRIVALGAGASTSGRSSLGLGYALGELLRRLDKRDGVWGFELPDYPITGAPAMPNRTLYLNSGAGRPKGVSLEHLSEAELTGYVDFLIESGISRLSFWQVHPGYLYPGNAEAQRPGNVRIHQVLRTIFDYARRRGLEVYHQLTPAYIDPSPLGDPDRYRGVGWYTEKAGHGGICWSQREVRELAQKMVRLEMEYFSPVDGYVVWFYDPAGCFCDQCKPNQAGVLYDQYQSIAARANDISPRARMQAVLWPTWIFPQYEHEGIPFNAEERDAFVKDFLGRLAAANPPRTVSIMDSCEGEYTNIFNGLVDPTVFQRNGFIYSLLGYPGETANIFMPYRFGQQGSVLGKARDAGLEESTLYDHYAPVSQPVVHGFARILYDKTIDGPAALASYAATVAKADARAPFTAMLEALGAMDDATTYEERETHLDAADAAWRMAAESPDLHVSREWMDGYLRAQRHYLAMARTTTPESFLQAYEAFKAGIGAIPMYEDFAARSLTPKVVAEMQVGTYWRHPCGDATSKGVPTH